MVGAAPQGNTVALRRNASAIEGDPVDSATRLLELLPPGGEQWQPDLAQTALNRAQAKINVLGLLSAHPVLLADFQDTDGHRHLQGTRIDRSRLLTDLLESRISPLFPILYEGDRTISNRLVHPHGFGVSETASILQNATPETRRSHCVDDECARLLTWGHFGEFLHHRADVARKVIADHVQSMALWGFADGPDPATWFADDLWGDTDAA